MVSGWRSFCCLCYDRDDSLFSPVHNDIQGSKKRKANHANGKATWTRRSLLEHEQSTEFCDAPMIHGSVAIPMKTTEREDDQLMKEHERFLKQMEGERSRRRRPVYNVFDKKTNGDSEGQDQGPTTTFPWMDDNFSASSRSITHLGISSVKINARRNELARRTSSDATDSSITPYSKQHPLYAKPQNSSTQANQNVPRLTAAQNMRTNPHNNALYAVKKPPVSIQGIHVPGKVGVKASNNTQHVYRAPSSEIGVRRINSGASNDHRVPRLGTYLETRSDLGPRPNPRTSTNGSIMQNGVYRLLSPSNTVTDVKHGTMGQPNSNTNYILQQKQAHVTHEEIARNFQSCVKETNSDINFSSEFVFRKANDTLSHSETSMQRSKQPLMFGAKNGKYELLSASKDTLKQKNKKGNYVNIPESMYGYVPKAVQNVQASVALGGNKIDDFFETRNDEGELIASLPSNGAIPDSETVARVTDQSDINVKHLQAGTEKELDSEVNVEVEHKPAVNCNQAVDCTKEDIEINTLKKSNTSEVKRAQVEADKTVKPVNGCVDDNHGNDDIIMINFPPNVNKLNDDDLVNGNEQTVNGDTTIANEETMTDCHASHVDNAEHSSLLGNIEVLY